VVLSRRRVRVLLMALVVAVMTLGIVGVLRAVSASPKDNDHNNNDKGRSTLTTLVKSRERGFVDLGPPGPTHGDIRVTNAPLYDASGEEKVGRLDLFCVATDPADESAEKAHMAECTVTYTLPGGEISAQGVQALPKFSEQTPGGVDAVSGGTGKYAGVRGEVRVESRGNKVIQTFRFIG
jgi:hypothetical protein